MSDTTAELTPGPGDYDQLLADLRGIITVGRQRAFAAVNRELVETYWQVGARIVQEEQQGKLRAAYGEQLLRRLGRALSQQFGRGFDATNLNNMRQFYLAYQNLDALRQDSLSWTHYRTLMRLSPEQREFYSRMAVRGRWSSRELDKQIQSMLYERVGISRKPEELAGSVLAPGGPGAVDGEVFKDPYILDFLGLADTYSEKDLEAAIVRNIERFLLELGNDFCFVARQSRMTIGGEDFHVDLVFYHRGLRCLVLIDLKIGAFEPADAAQMQLYLEWARRHDKRQGEEDPIGLILCGSRNEQVVELLVASQSHDLRVAQYLLFNDMEAIRQRLAQISQAVDQLRETQEPASREGPEVEGCREPR